MTYKFKYHPDNAIYKDGAFHKPFAQFIADNPGFPIIQGQYFELKTNGSLELIKEVITPSNTTYSHEIVEDLTPYQDLITAIGE